MFWNNSPEAKTTANETTADDKNTEPEALAKRSIREIAELARTMDKTKESNSASALIVNAMLITLLNLPKIYKLALEVIGGSITDKMITMVEEHVAKGGERPSVRTLAVICGMPLCMVDEMEALLAKQMSTDALGHDELITHVLKQMPESELRKMADKWNDAGHVRAAMIQHLEETLALLKAGDTAMTSEQMLKECMDVHLISEAAVQLSTVKAGRLMHVSRLIKFQSMANEPSLAAAATPEEAPASA